ncbi:hypothetical protein GOBAR_DD07026 [Gossypium barbadense]|nr:hypothetical protein GOBAR_DD07026 [Gossypium barbadense]
MASFNCLALAFLIALSFASIDVGVAARHLLQQPQPQSLPYFSNLPTPSRQSFPWPGALPPLPTTLPTGLPPSAKHSLSPHNPNCCSPYSFLFSTIAIFPLSPKPWGASSTSYHIAKRTAASSKHSLNPSCSSLYSFLFSTTF